MQLELNIIKLECLVLELLPECRFASTLHSWATHADSSTDPEVHALSDEEYLYILDFIHCEDEETFDKPACGTVTMALVKLLCSVHKLCCYNIHS